MNYRKLAEKIFIRELITERYPTGIISIVADSFNFWDVITDIAKELKPEIMARKPNALGLNKVVFRPDSGDPVKILTGYKVLEVDSLTDWNSFDVSYQYEAVLFEGDYYTFSTDFDDVYGATYNHRIILEDILSEAEVKGAVECLWDIFGGTVTDKGYKVLDEHVGLIYGDSITLERADTILKRLEAKGFASCNVVFGVGSYTYNYLTRDTFGFAMKATYGVVKDEGRELFKDPITDSGTKKSAKGLLRVEKEGDNFVLYDQQSADQEKTGELLPVFFNGVVLRDESLGDIRGRLV